MRPESLDDYIAILRRRGFLILLVALLVSGGILSVGLRLPRVYTADVLIDVEAGQKTGVSLLPNLVQTALGGGADPVVMQTFVNRLSTRTLLEQARRDYGDLEPVGARLLPPTPQLAGLVRAGVETGSRLITVSLELREDQGGPRNAALFVNRLVETFRRQLAAEERQDRLREAGSQLDQIETMQSELREELDRMRRDLLAFVREAGNPTVWSTELAQLYQRQSTLLRERRVAETRRRAASVSTEKLADALDAEPPIVLSGRTESPHALRSQLAEEVALYEARSAQKAAEGLTAEAPERKGLEAARMLLEKRLGKLPEYAVSRSYALNPRRDQLWERQLESALTLAEVEGEIAEIDALLDEVSAEIERRTLEVPEQQVRLEILQRQVESVTKVYEELMLRRSQVELGLREALAKEEEGRRIGGVAIVDPARPKLRPIRPRVTLLVAVAGMLGLLGGVGVGLFVEWMDGVRRSVRPESSTDSASVSAEKNP